MTYCTLFIHPYVDTQLGARCYVADGEINDYPLKNSWEQLTLLTVDSGDNMQEDLSEQLLDLEPHQIVVIRTDMSEVWL